MDAADTKATPRAERVLVIDDEAVVCQSCVRVLASAGLQVEYRLDARAGLAAARQGDFDLILLDLKLPELDGLEVLRQLRAEGVAAQVVIVTGHATVATAVDAMKGGAVDYVAKPFTPDELTLVVRRVLERSALVRENAALRRELAERRQFEGLIGGSQAMERVFAVIRRVAPSPGTVLITGESGTGKEMVARAIHTLSPRAREAFVACDCSALAPTLLESELFGHVKGSFSGAVATKQGLFEVASRGTLFLDEVANIGLETQGKLLRALETRQIRRVGDTEERSVDIRLVAATNRELAEMLREGTFREDLYYRLNVVPVHLPPLRERRGDVARLAMAFLARLQAAAQTRVQGFTPEAMRRLEAYSWPGNVRELKNIVERLAILCEADHVEPRHLPPEIGQAPAPAVLPQLPTQWAEFKEYKRQARDALLQELDRRFLGEALQRSAGNVTRAAEDVGMLRTNLHALLRKYGLGEDEG
jgi:DNA-binding NtrC family response regulator